MAVTSYHDFARVYMIRNTVNDKRYIGSAVHVGQRSGNASLPDE